MDGCVFLNKCPTRMSSCAWKIYICIYILSYRVKSCTGRFCGSKIPDTLISSDTRMWIEYRNSRGGTKGKGFFAEYEGKYIAFVCCMNALTKIKGSRGDFEGKCLRELSLMDSLTKTRVQQFPHSFTHQTTCIGNLLMFLMLCCCIIVAQQTIAQATEKWFSVEL